MIRKLANITQRGEGRYFGTQEDQVLPTCRKCREKGHLAAQCTAIIVSKSTHSEQASINININCSAILVARKVMSRNSALNPRDALNAASLGI